MNKIQDVNLALQEGSKAIERIANIINEMSSEADKRVHNINNLLVIAKDIKQDVSHLVDVNNNVKEIDNQTTLLSLNTAIQAAHLGSQGAAFSVIAKEMKTLSEKSRIGTSEMTKLFSKIENKTGNIHTVIEVARNNAEMNSVAMQEVAAMTEQMLANVQELASILESIARE